MLTTFGGVVGVALMRTDAVVVDVVVGGCGQALPLVAALVRRRPFCVVVAAVDD
jgi:hypothetical protein